MKKLILIGLALTLFIACQNQPQRYFEQSQEIESLKAAITAYEAGDWDTWKSHFADTAKIYHNTLKGASNNEVIEMMSGMISNLSSYGFSKDGAEYEMVIDSKGKTWVNYWNAWKGKTKVTEKEIIVPVHITAQFIEGKIVKEYAYYNPTELQAAIAEIVAIKAAEEAEASEEKDE